MRTEVALPTALLTGFLIFFSGCVETGYVAYPDENETNITNTTTTLPETTTSSTAMTSSTTTTSSSGSDGDGGSGGAGGTGARANVIPDECPESCDDNDPCTEDYCSEQTDYDCRHDAVEPCCGNSICEDNEVCNEDCIVSLTITDIHYQDPEWVEIENNGNHVNMTNWTLEDIAQHVYTFQDFILRENSSLQLHTNQGTDNETDLYWNRSASVWNNEGDNATLKNEEGNIISEYSYPIQTTTTTTTTTTSTTTTPETTTSTTTTTSSTTTSTTTTTTTTIATTTTTTSTTTIPSIDYILISEVYYAATVGQHLKEWVELYNPTQNAITMENYSLSNNSYTWELPNITIESLYYITIARNATGFYELYSCYPDIEGMTLALNDLSDQLALDSSEQEIDFVAWGTEEWNISATTNHSIVRNNIDTDTAADWLSEQTPDPACVTQS